MTDISFGLSKVKIHISDAYLRKILRYLTSGLSKKKTNKQTKTPTTTQQQMPKDEARLVQDIMAKILVVLLIQVYHTFKYQHCIPINSIHYNCWKVLHLQEEKSYRHFSLCSLIGLRIWCHKTHIKSHIYFAICY